MAWIYLAASADSASPWNHGCEQSPTVKTTDTLNPFCFHEWQTASSLSLPYGTMCELYTGECFPELTSSLADSPAKTLALQAMEKAWVESALSFSLRLQDSRARFDRDSFSWKMLQPSLFEGLIESPPNFPRSGMTVGGTCYELAMWERPIKENDGGSWPTPVARDSRSHGQSNSRRRLDKHRTSLPLSQVFKDRFGYRLPPNFVEYLMGYVPRHTVLDAWAMQWFRSARAKPSKDSQGSKSPQSAP